MKESRYTFGEGFLGMANEKKVGQRQFDWNKAAKIIKERLKTNPDLVAEAGLQGDWNYTGGVIFQDGKPTRENYTYLSSNWAEPSLAIDDETIPCFMDGDDSDSKWPDEAIKILGIEP